MTTTIIHRSTATVYATLPADAGDSEGAEVTAKQGNVDSGAELTTTYTRTSTTSSYITVTAEPSGAAEGALGTGAAEGGCVPVTVTVAASTVTVVS